MPYAAPTVNDKEIAGRCVFIQVYSFMYRCTRGLYVMGSCSHAVTPISPLYTIRCVTLSTRPQRTYSQPFAPSTKWIAYRRQIDPPPPLPPPPRHVYEQVVYALPPLHRCDPPQETLDAPRPPPLPPPLPLLHPLRHPPTLTPPRRREPSQRRDDVPPPSRRRWTLRQNPNPPLLHQTRRRRPQRGCLASPPTIRCRRRRVGACSRPCLSLFQVCRVCPL